MRKKLYLIMALFILFSLCPVASAEDMNEQDSFMEYILSLGSLEPITEINVSGNLYEFEYENGKRVKLTGENLNRSFEFNGEVLSRQRDENITLTFFSCGGKYVGFQLQGMDYSLIYDENGNVIALSNDQRECICEYQYVGALSNVVYLSENERDILAADKNPFRYKGWYLDVETTLYYLGEGMYYNPQTEEYIQNEFQFEVIEGEPSIIQTVTNAYYTMMGMSTYGASYYAFPSQTNWDNGIRWYDGIQQIELLARCIYAENLSVNRPNDRKAVGLVIRNRVEQNFPHQGTLSPYNIIRYPSAFATVNPSGTLSSMTSSTYDARQVMDKTNSAFQQATLIACMLYCSTNYSDYNVVIGIPTPMDNQYTHFLSVNYAYSQNVFSVSSGGQWSYGGTSIYGVCISGTGLLTSIYGTGSHCLQNYYLAGYNVFFHY